jgi:polyhydroxybutyrate depolymerase
MLAFHGFTSNGAQLRASLGFDTLTESDGVIVVHPDGHDGVRLLGTTGRGWDVGASKDRDTRFVTALLDHIEAGRCVDRARVFATGFSNGGFFSSLLACTLADRVAAVAAVGGARALGDCAPARPVPILLLHGRADEIVDPARVRDARDWWAGRNACGAPSDGADCRRYTDCRAEVVHCEGPHGHTWPRDGRATVWRFFAAHPLAAPG